MASNVQDGGVIASQARQWSLFPWPKTFNRMRRDVSTCRRNPPLFLRKAQKFTDYPAFSFLVAVGIVTFMWSASMIVFASVLVRAVE